MSYRETGKEYLDKAHEAIEAGDYLQASEKLWGGAALTVKAVAEDRGWEHHGHALLYEIAERLSDETGDPEVSVLFRLAGQLHTNFYENWLPRATVIRGEDEVELLIDKLEGALDAQR